MFQHSLEMAVGIALGSAAGRDLCPETEKVCHVRDTARKVGLVWHERYAWHDAGNWAGNFPHGGLFEPGRHAENPETKRRIYSLLAVSGVLDQLVQVKPRPATNEELRWFHTQPYLDHLEAFSDAGGGETGESASMGPDTWPIAQLAAGGVIEACDQILKGELDMAYALVRPPGHHAERDRARGFCFLANTALAAFHALNVHGLERVAVVDWDVHHGNGTEQAFYDDPRVLTISVHEDRNYPVDSGQPEDRGEGRGFGANINVPLPPGSGEGAYLHTFDTLVLPALERFQPQLILIASGFDASLHDPLGHMLLGARSYRAMTERLIDAAEALCGGRLLAMHEGGYSPEYVPFCGQAVLEAMLGTTESSFDPVEDRLKLMPSFEVEPHQRARIDALGYLLDDVPSPG